jgi:hypothetical protein
MKLSEELLDNIDGAEECQGRDSQLTRWVEAAEVLEHRNRQLKLCIMGMLERWNPAPTDVLSVATVKAARDMLKTA